MRIKKDSTTASVLSYVLFSVLFMCSAILVGFLAGNMYEISLQSPYLQTSAESDSTEDSTCENNSFGLIMIDPGHGGEDGGAESDSGLVEKELNMYVSQNIADMCLIFGIPYKMSRESDTLLYNYYSDLEDYTGKKKSYDLKNRLKLTEETDASLYLGIHMNKFSDSRYSGLQVYFSPNAAESESIAHDVQSFVRSHLQPSNTREAKRAGSSIYILNQLERPALLVECGFLSNTEEAALLGDGNYRSSLATTIFTPILEYFVRSKA